MHNWWMCVFRLCLVSAQASQTWAKESEFRAFLQSTGRFRFGRKPEISRTLGISTGPQVFGREDHFQVSWCRCALDTSRRYWQLWRFWWIWPLIPSQIFTTRKIRQKLRRRPFKKISDLIWLDTMGPCITLHTFLSNHHQSISIIIFRYTQSLADLVGM